MIYRVHLYSNEIGSDGYAYFATKREAEFFANEFVRQGYDRDEIEQAPTPRTKAEMVALLRDWGGHNDNG